MWTKCEFVSSMAYYGADTAAVDLLLKYTKLTQPRMKANLINSTMSKDAKKIGSACTEVTARSVAM